ncbi:MAG: DUF58 domain-containing protein [Chloroflexi bacterium]|nr:DUF58 domain-containing protein [Chloroflexota bacterium]
MLNDFWLFASAVLLFVGLVATQGILLIVGSLVLIVWILAKFWDRFAFKKVNHGRSLARARAFVGDTVEYSVTLANNKVVPLIWVDIQDTFPRQLELPGATVRGTGMEVEREHRITTSLLPYQQVTWKYNLRCLARGYHRIGPAKLRSGDIFGFTAAETRFEGVDHILVYPRVIDLKELILPTEHPLGETRGQRPIYEDPTRFFGLRDYHPRDPMKHIDWKATARRSRLQTKVFEPVVALNVLIAMNATTAEFAWQGSNRRLFERAVTVAASVADHCARAGYEFGLISNGVAVYSGKWLSVPFGSSSHQLGLVLESLAMAGPYSVVSLSDVLQQERSLLPPGATVVVITSVVTRALEAEIHDMQARGYKVLLLYSGDGGPEFRLTGVQVYSLGRVLEVLDADPIVNEAAESDEPVLAR